MRREHVIEIRLDVIGRLFNSMDPSPFKERDLDHDAEEFIVSWAEEYPAGDPLSLLIRLHHPPDPPGAAEIEAAILRHFDYRATLSRLEFDRMMRDAALSLGIGIVFLAVCLTAAHALGGRVPDSGGWRPVFAEVLTIAGWVAMWKPVDTALYHWWPLRRRLRILRKLAGVPVRVTVDAPENAKAPGAAGA